MNREKHTTRTAVLAFLALIITLIAVSVFVPFKEGTLVFSLFEYARVSLSSACGFFRGGSLESFSIIPLAVLIILLVFDSAFDRPAVCCIAHICLYFGLYFASSYLFGASEYPLSKRLGSGGSICASLFFIVFSLFTLTLSDLSDIKHRRNINKHKESKNEEKTLSERNESAVLPKILNNAIESEYSKVSDIPDNNSHPLEEEYASTPMNPQEALAAIKDVGLPDFVVFPMDPPTGVEGFFNTVGEETRILEQGREKRAQIENASKHDQREKFLSNLFKPRLLQEKIEEDRIASESFPKVADESDYDQIDSSFRKKQSVIRNRQNVAENKPGEAKKQVPDTPMTVQGGSCVVQPMKAGVKTEVFMPMGVEKKDTAQPMKFNGNTPVVMPVPVKTSVFTEAEETDKAFIPVEDVDCNASNVVVQEPAEPDDSEITAATEKYKRLVEADGTGSPVQDPESPDFDDVSGVAGLSKPDSYLINKDRFVYKYPESGLLRHYEVSETVCINPEEDTDGQTIVDTLAQFHIETRLLKVQHGPTFTLYELALARGIRVNSVTNLADNIAMDLAVDAVRILAPIPGKVAIGIEVPNKKRDTIGFDIMYPALKSKSLKIPFVLGKTITGETIVIDLAGTPHLLIAGTTGSGKSVCVNSLICSVLYTKTPAEVRMMLVDPKMVELSVYNGIPHLLTPVITNPKRAIKGIAFIITEMERRMALFQKCGVKKIEDYNTKISQSHYLACKLPYIMVIIDEFADLMMVVGKELESYIQRITQIARFTGIHLVLATQRPSVDVITGIIKSNIPSRIAFAVSDVTNSKIILDTPGAEKLLGRGDMLYLSSTCPTPQRIQGAYIDPEIEQIVAAIKENGEPDYIDESYFEDDEDDDSSASVSSSAEAQDIFTKAWKIVTEKGEASASYLQRKLGIGYNRAATLIEKLEDAGYIGPARGSKPREILKNYNAGEF